MSHELVAEHALEAHVALGDLEVGRADAHACGPNDHLAGLGCSSGAVVDVFDLFAVVDDCLHGRSSFKFLVSSF